MNLSPEDKAKLAKLVDANQAVDNSEKIRKLRHSPLLDADIIAMTQLKVSHARLLETKPDLFEAMARTQCDFTANNYPGIFSRLLKGTLDISLLRKLISVLQRIERGDLSQHEASVAVGMILKDIYIDKALEGKEGGTDGSGDRAEPKQISWSQYSKMSVE